MIYIIIFAFVWLIWVGLKSTVKDAAHDVHSMVKDSRSKETVIDNWQNVVQKKGLNLSNKSIVYMYLSKGNETLYVPQFIWREGNNLALFMDNPKNWLPLGGGWQSLIYEENININYITISNISRIYRMNNLCHMEFKNDSSILFRIDSFSVFQSICPEVI